ncbi:hypothetical protein V1638_04180 [Pseudarthrobacter sp. J64]|uniref:hypothetical protein n=1 Tax=Pseudarthrobacter sp. J64 TaxID=3116485 RepID=UPI002E80C46C|nr:hypothetical protein [Pseudarthrobacter sp. J64]MEE2568594.1 hypothetical protein [Pseudarthrobacter sp. J64]
MTKQRSKVIKHGDKPGLTGYRKGCGCEVCGQAKSDDNAAYRAKKKLQEAAGVDQRQHLLPTVPDIQPSSMAIAWNAPAGPIETTLISELDALIGEPPFKKTLLVLAKYNARVLDQIPQLERPDLISGMQSRLFNVFDRLRRTETTAGASSWDMSALLATDD